MINSKKNRASIIVVAVLFGLNHLFAQLSTSNGNVTWVNDVINEKVFIKNLGQFDHFQNMSQHPVEYAFEKNGFRALFSADGVTYDYESVDLESSSSEFTFL